MALPLSAARRILTDADITRPGALRDALMSGGGGPGATGGYDVIVAAGQSNMAGSGEPFGEFLDPIHPSIDQYGFLNRTIRPAAEPLDFNGIRDGIGPALQFARWYATEQLAPGRRVLLVPSAKGGSRLCSDTGESWRATRPTPSLYAASIEQTLEALSEAGGGVHRVVALLWSQGESDGASFSTPAATYQTDLDDLIGAYREDLGVPDLPTIIGPMVPEWLGSGTSDDINVVHAQTPYRVPFTAWTPPTDAMGHDPADPIHWPAPAQRVIGHDMYRQWVRTAAGVAPTTPIPAG